MRNRILFSSLCLASVLGGCHMDQRYVSPEGMLCMAPPCTTWQLAMTPATPVYLEGEEAALFIIETRVPFPVRRPTDEQMAALQVPTGPYPYTPWVQRGDYEIELQYTVSNLSDERQTVTVVANGWNEFHEYMPAAAIVDDELVIDFAGYERVYAMDPGERVTATIREEQVDEIAVDLATVVNGAPNSNQVVYFLNQSAFDERAQPFIPPIIPALAGLRMGLRVESAPGATAPPIALEFSIHIRDPHDRIVAEGEVPWTDMPMPALFAPVAPMVAP